MQVILITLGQLIFSLSMFAMGIFYFGAALTPGAALLLNVWRNTQSVDLWHRCFYLGLAASAAYFIFGLTLILLVGLTRTLLFLRLKEGNYPIFSLQSMKWAFISTLYLLINLTFVDFILLTPFVNVLLRLMGAKLGKNVQINSKNVYDATLVEIGDNTLVGGGAIIIGHIVERGILKLKKVKIGKNVTIGSHSTVMPGCVIGDGAIIGVSAVLLKNTKVEPRAIYFGVPAEPIRRRYIVKKDNEQNAKKEE